MTAYVDDGLSIRTVRGANRIDKALYSLVETAKANGIEPWAYLNHVFERLPEASGSEDIEALLPWRVEIKELVARVATD